MEPTKKSPEMEAFLEEAFGRTGAIRSNKCIPPPVGCGGPAEYFRSQLSIDEYRISGLCQKCQDTVFGK